MPRKARINAPGAIHHIVFRGIERKAIFTDDKDRNRFMDHIFEMKMNLNFRKRTTREKKIIVVLYVVVCLLIATDILEANGQYLEVEKKAPDFALNDLNGNRIALRDYIGKKKVILIIVWGVWCPYCRATMVRLKDIYDHYKDDGLEILAVSIRESASKVSLFIDRLKPGFPVLIDEFGDLRDPYRVKDVPRIVLLDRQGIVRCTTITTSDEKIAELIREAMAR